MAKTRLAVASSPKCIALRYTKACSTLANSRPSRTKGASYQLLRQPLSSRGL